MSCIMETLSEECGQEKPVKQQWRLVLFHLKVQQRVECRRTYVWPTSNKENSPGRTKEKCKWFVVLQIMSTGIRSLWRGTIIINGLCTTGRPCICYTFLLFLIVLIRYKLFILAKMQLYLSYKRAASSCEPTVPKWICFLSTFIAACHFIFLK